MSRILKALMWWENNHLRASKMPIYSYECLECEKNFKIRHGMDEGCERCEECGSKDIWRIPSDFTNPAKPRVRHHKVGDTTKDFIESARKDLQIQKEDLSKKR